MKDIYTNNSLKKTTSKHIEICPLCGSINLKPKFVCKDYFASNEEFELYSCLDCGFLFTQNFPSNDVIGKYYDVSEYVSHSDTKEGIVNKIYHTVRQYMINKKMNFVEKQSGKERGAILDMGCGTGYFLNAAKQKGWDTVGIEKSEHARNAAINRFGLNVYDETHIDHLPQAHFDVITLWHVLEHLEDLNEVMDKIYRLLLPNGIAVIAVPNCSSYDAQHYKTCWAAYDVPRHLWHFTPQTMTMLAEKFNFKIVRQKLLAFDSFYVSLLSEKYKRTNPVVAHIKAFVIGLLSNMKTWPKKGKNKGSSVVFVLRKFEEFERFTDLKQNEYLTFYGNLEYWNGEDEGDVRYYYLIVNSDGKIVTEFSSYNRPNSPIKQEQTLLQKALTIVSNAFRYQKDKADKPYIFHLLYVMGKGKNEKEKIVGALHDLIEDCGKSYENVILEEFGQEILNAVKCLTKTKGEDYDVYLQKVKENKLARQVKLYDLEHNMDINRLSNLTQEDYDRLEKYKKSYNYLSIKI